MDMTIYVYSLNWIHSSILRSLCSFLQKKYGLLSRPLFRDFRSLCWELCSIHLINKNNQERRVYTYKAPGSSSPLITAAIRKFLQMLLPLFVHVESILVRRLDLAQRTPELIPRRRRRRRRRDSQLSSPAVTLPVDVGLQHGITGEFDHAQLASEVSACDVKH